MALLVVLVVVGVVGGLLIATSGGGSSKQNAANTGRRSSNIAAARRRARAAPVAASSVTIAVLNGTSTNGLAGRISQTLSGAGYKQGKIATAADQTRTATVVAYLPGHRSAALEVARTLKLGPASVHAADSSTIAVACPPPGACADDVIVTVGSDLATTQ